MNTTNKDLWQGFQDAMQVAFDDSLARLDALSDEEIEAAWDLYEPRIDSQWDEREDGL